MNSKIICMLQPFALKQQIYVYENGNKMETEKVSMSELNKMIISLLDKHTQINTIEMVGPKKFSKGIGNQLQTELVTKYSETRNIEINYI